MQRHGVVILFILAVAVISGSAQVIGGKSLEEDEWDRTRKILDCAPRLVDRRELVEDNFNHRYVTNNPRDIEVGYFSVEPITYLEEGRRFCEVLLPAVGISETYFRGCYITSFNLPGDGMYQVNFKSNALIFNNEIRIINSQNTLGEIKAIHRLEIELDTALNPLVPGVVSFISSQVFSWELEIDQTGVWRGELLPGEIDLIDAEVPAGFSLLELKRRIRGPGKVTIRESVIFRVNSISSYKYDPIFQADCLFSLEPLSVSTSLLPCEE